IIPYTDFLRVHVLAVHQGGNGAAHPILAEAPAMIGALDRVFRQDFSRRERHAAMGTAVAHGKGCAVAHPAQENRFAQKHLAPHPARFEARRQRGHVPEVADVTSVRHGAPPIMPGGISPGMPSMPGGMPGGPGGGGGTVRIFGMSTIRASPFSLGSLNSKP